MNIRDVRPIALIAAAVLFNPCRAALAADPPPVAYRHRGRRLRPEGRHNTLDVLTCKECHGIGIILVPAEASAGKSNIPEQDERRAKAALGARLLRATFFLTRHSSAP
jgi:hypothetical protein